MKHRVGTILICTEDVLMNDSDYNRDFTEGLVYKICKIEEGAYVFIDDDGDEHFMDEEHVADWKVFTKKQVRKPTARTKREEYREFEGRKFDLIASDGKVIKAVLVGANRSVGITAVAEHDKDWKLICLNGPISKKYNVLSDDAYHKAFDYLIGAIISGSYNFGEISMISRGRMPRGGSVSCPYGT